MHYDVKKIATKKNYISKVQITIHCIIILNIIQRYVRIRIELKLYFIANNRFKLFPSKV